MCENRGAPGGSFLSSSKDEIVKSDGLRCSFFFLLPELHGRPSDLVEPSVLGDTRKVRSSSALS